jgi:hypothetical protein
MNGLNSIRFIIEHLKARQDKFGKLPDARASESGQMLGVRDMSKTFSTCEKLLVNKQFKDVHAAIFKFKKMPSIMTVGGFTPEFDYDGLLLQRLGRDESEYHQIGLSIESLSRGGAVYHLDHDVEVCDRFVNSRLAQDPILYSTLAIQTAFEHLENTCMNIPWWDGLRAIERETLQRRMQYAGSPHEDRMPSCLDTVGSHSINGILIHSNPFAWGSAE